MSDTKQLFVDIVNEYSSIDVTIENVDFLDLITDCEYDSIQLIEFICTVEDVFGITIEDEYMTTEKIRDLNGLYKHIKNISDNL